MTPATLTLLLQIIHGTCQLGDRVTLERDTVETFYSCSSYGTWLQESSRPKPRPPAKAAASCPSPSPSPRLVEETRTPCEIVLTGVGITERQDETRPPSQRPRVRPDWLPEKIATHLPDRLLEQLNRGWVKWAGKGLLGVLWLALLIFLWKRANKPTWTDNRWEQGLGDGGKR